MKTYSHMALAAALIALALPATGFAQTIITPASAGRIQDTSLGAGLGGDGLGDSVGAQTGPSPATLIAGDTTGNNQFRSAFEFNITSAEIKLAITNAPATGGVFYSITVESKLGTPSDLLLVGYTPADANNLVQASDFQAVGMTLGTFSSSTSVATPVVFNVDVTDFAKANVAGNSLGFRLQVATPSFNGVADDYRFQLTNATDATLTIVPEPTALAMVLGGAGLLALRRRRR